MRENPRVVLTRLPGADGVPIPRYMSELAAGADLCAAIEADLTLLPGARALVPTGFSMAIPAGYEGQVRPRSGLALKYGITCLNSPGTIDADYRGPVGVILANLGTEPFVLRRGDRIAQLVIASVAHAQFDVELELVETQRGTGGFGSTGTI